MTIGQADTINKLYRSYNDTINGLNTTIIKNKSLFYDTIIKKVTYKEDSTDYYKGQFYAAQVAIHEIGYDNKRLEIRTAFFLFMVMSIMLSSAIAKH